MRYWLRPACQNPFLSGSNQYNNVVLAFETVKGKPRNFAGNKAFLRVKPIKQMQHLPVQLKAY